MGPPLEGDSSDATPAVRGINTGAVALGDAPGVFGESSQGVGVAGLSNGDKYAGVWAQNTGGGPAVRADSNTGNAVLARSASGTAIWALGAGDPATAPDAVYAQTSSSEHAAVSANNYGKGFGVWAFSQEGAALQASTNGDSDAIRASTASRGHAAVSATNTADANPALGPFSQFGVWASSNNTAIYGQGNPAGYFDGDIYAQGYLYCNLDVRVAGDLLLINSSSGDIAEDFDLEDDPANAEPGTVLVIHQSGKLSACTEPYDTRVAGVVSGAGNLRPAIVLQRLQERPDRSPLALVGKALCKVDAAFGSIAAGDLLTTSATPGHAMKVADRTKAVGAILGKALYPLDTGHGLVPILVSLR
jgi:hypothetical protein